MKLLPFKEILAMSKDKVNEAMAPIRARQIKSQAELEMARIEADILSKETLIQEMCTTKDVNFSYLIDCWDDVALLERRKAQYVLALEQLFPKE
jgi:hypothetical protein